MPEISPESQRCADSCANCPLQFRRSRIEATAGAKEIPVRLLLGEAEAGHLPARYFMAGVIDEVGRVDAVDRRMADQRFGLAMRSPVDFLLWRGANCSTVGRDCRWRELKRKPSLVRHY